MSVELAELALKVDAQGFVKADTAMTKFNRTASRTEAQAEKITKQSESMAKSIRRAASSVGMIAAAFAAVGFAALTRDIFANSEAFKQLNNQLRQVSSSEAELINIRQGLFAISRQTNTAIESTVALYTDLYRSTRDLGTTQKEVAEVTRTINNLFLAGGKSAAETSGAIRQLSQGLASGALRGDEFNSVAEGAPRIMDALAEKLRMTRGELREFAATGGITSQIMVEALSSYSDEAQRLADMTDKTFGQRMTNAKNNMIQFAGSLDMAAGLIGDAGAMIERFTASLASGQAMASLQAWVSQWGVAARDIMSAIDMINKFSDESASSVGFSWKNAFLNMPANITAMVKIWAVELASMWDYAKLYAGLIVDAFKTEFVAIGNAALTAGEVILNNLNPFNEQRDLFAEYGKALADPFKTLAAEVKASHAIISDARQQSIVDIMAERDKAVQSSNDQRKAGDELFKAWEAGRGVFTDAAEGVKEFGVAADLSYEQIVKLNSEMDKLLKGDLFSFGDSNDSAQKIVDGLQAQYDQLVLNEEQLNEIAKAHLHAQLISEKATDSQIEDAMRLFDAIAEAQNQNDPIAHWANSIDAVSDGISKMQGALQDGSKEAKKLGVALQALAVVQGIIAVLTQGQGDPYTSFARMAAMAAAVVSLGVQIGSMSGGEDSAQQRQQSQGTGTVFGDANAKSESISKAIELTASSTSELVGLNRGMLQALQQMQAGISSATSMIFRGIGGASLPGAGRQVGFEELTTGNISDLTSGVINDEWLQAALNPLEALFGVDIHFLDDMMGSKSKVIDEGIMIAGGRIMELIDGTLVEAFQDVESKKHFLASTRTNRFSEVIDSAIGQQLGLIFGGMADAVTSAAGILGIADTDIQSAIQNFMVSAIEISLKDLTAEEQQAELEAVFSSVFDGLAGAVVPFVDEFVKVGEGYAETLIRIATQVQVATEASKQLGFAIAEGLSPVELARFSDELINLGGGVEAFIGKMQQFVSAFATDEHKFTTASRNINAAMEQAGLEVPASRDALFELMGTLTDPAQINTLLDLTKSFEQYYDALEKAERTAEQAANEAAQALVDAANAARNLGETALNSLVAAADAERARIGSIVSNATNAQAAVQSAVEREKALLQSAHDTNISLMMEQAKAERTVTDALHKARIDNINSEIQAAEESAANLRGIAKSLTDAVFNMGVQSDAQSLRRRDAADREIAVALQAAKRGDFSLAGNLDRAISEVSRDPSNMMGSAVDVARAMAVSQNRLADLAKVAEGAATKEDQMIEVLRGQLAATESVNTTIMTETEALITNAQAAHLSEMKALDAIAEQTRAQLESLTGVTDPADLSLADALTTFQESLLAADFENAQSEYARLDLLISDSRSQLNALLGIDTRVLSLNEAFENFSDVMVELGADPTMQMQLDTTRELLEEIAQMREEMREANLSMARHQAQTASILNRIELDGLDVRVEEPA